MYLIFSLLSNNVGVILDRVDIEITQERRPSGMPVLKAPRVPQSRALTFIPQLNATSVKNLLPRQ